MVCLFSRRRYLTLSLSLVLGLGLSQSLFAGDGSVAPGREVVITLQANGLAVRGRLASLDLERIVIRAVGQEQTFSLQDVRSVAVRGDSVKNGAVIGGLLGAVWCAVVCGQGLDSTSTLPLAVAASGGLGALIGAGFDAAIPGYRIVYQRPVSATRTQQPIGPALFRWRF